MAVTITNDAATTRTNLGLGDAATKTVGTASGNIPVLDSSGKLASGRMPTFKTVGGSSIVGSGDISTLPSGGTANQVLTSDASSNATWATPAESGFAPYGRRNWLSSTVNVGHDSYVRLSMNSTDYEGGGSGKILHDAGKWTVVDAGYYLLDLKIYFTSQNSTYHQGFIKVWDTTPGNGTSLAYSIRDGLNVYDTIRCRDTLYFAAGASFKLEIKSNDTSYAIASGTESTYFNIWRVL